MCCNINCYAPIILLNSSNSTSFTPPALNTKPTAIKDDIYYYPDCETMTDVAYYYIDELQALGDIPPSLQNYIDYEAYGRDLDMGGCFIETSRGMCEIPY